MARVLFGGLVDAVLGSLGGVTFSVNKGGYYCKARRAGSNPKTTTQTARRADFSQFPSLWLDLDPGERAAWDAWAADPAQDREDYWGNTYHLSGYQSFIWIGMCRLSVARTVPIAPPASFKPATPTITSATPTASPGAEVAWVWPNLEFYAWDFVCRHAVSDTVTPAFFPYQRAVITDYLQAPGPATGFSEEGLDDHFGVLAPGQRIWSQAARQTEDGYRSAWFTLSGDLA